MSTRNITYIGADTGRHPASGIHTPEFFARRPYIGVVLFFIGSLFFGFFALNLFTHGPLIPWDQKIATVLPAYGLQHEALLKPVMDTGYFIGGWVILILAGIFSIYFLARKFWEELVMLLAGLGGEMALFEAVSISIGRVRPPTQIWIILHIPGFPSGHTMASVVFFGFLAYLLVPRVSSVPGKALIILVALLLMLFVGFTRVFTAAHYLTDVLGGYALGTAWAGISYPLVELYYKQRRNRNGEKR